MGLKKRKESMYSIITLLVLQAHANELDANYTATGQDIINELTDQQVNKLIARARKIGLFHDVDLDDATLGKKRTEVTTLTATTTLNYLNPFNPSTFQGFLRPLGKEDDWKAAIGIVAYHVAAMVAAAGVGKFLLDRQKH